MSHPPRVASAVKTNAPLRVPTSIRTPLLPSSFLMVQRSVSGCLLVRLPDPEDVPFRVLQPREPAHPLHRRLRHDLLAAEAPGLLGILVDALDADVVHRLVAGVLAARQPAIHAGAGGLTHLARRDGRDHPVFGPSLGAPLLALPSE